MIIITLCFDLSHVLVNKLSPHAHLEAESIATLTLSKHLETNVIPHFLTPDPLYLLMFFG